MNGPQWMTVPEEIRPNLHVLARTEFLLPPGSWMLHLSAKDYCHAWLDGQWLGQGPAPGPEGSCWYQEYPVESGRTVILAVHLYYQGLVNRVWNSSAGRC